MLYGIFSSLLGPLQQSVGINENFFLSVVEARKFKSQCLTVPFPTLKRYGEEEPRTSVLIFFYKDTSLIGLG